MALRPRCVRVTTCAIYTPQTRAAHTIPCPFHQHPMDGKGSDHVDRVRTQLEAVRGQDGQNIELAIERGRDLEAMQDKAEQLEADAAQFRKGARSSSGARG